MIKSVLITGASRGIGREAAILFASQGWHLHLTCKTHYEALKALQHDITSHFPVSCHTYQCDMSDFSEVEKLFSQIDQLSVLINNAGISHIGLLSDMSETDWHRVMQTNLDSVFYTSKCAIPLFLRQQYGSIVNVSSVWGNVGASMEVAYSASKGGVNSFTKALAKELAPSHITVNAVAFGMIDTEMNACYSEAERLAIQDEIPADRIASPIEAAEMLLTIATSPDYLTGQVITFDGGWT